MTGMVKRKLRSEFAHQRAAAMKVKVPGYVTIRKELLAVFRGKDTTLEDVRRVFDSHEIESKATRVMVLDSITRYKMDFYCRLLDMPDVRAAKAVEVKPVVVENDQKKLEKVKARKDKITTAKIARMLGIPTHAIYNAFNSGKLARPGGKSKGTKRGRGSEMTWTSEDVERVKAYFKEE